MCTKLRFIVGHSGTAWLVVVHKLRSALLRVGTVQPPPLTVPTGA